MITMAFGDNLRQAWQLTKDSFALIGRDKSLLLPPILMLITNIALTVILIYAFVSAFFTGAPNPFGFIYFWALLILFAILTAFLNAFWSAALAWMVSQVARGEDATLFSGIWRALKNIFDVILYAIVSFLIAGAANSLRQQRRNIFSTFIAGMFAEIVKEAWDIAGHLTLPAMIVKDQNFFSALKEVKNVVKHLPEALVGGFAFDFIAKGLGAFVFFIGAVVGILSFPLIGLWAIAVGMLVWFGLGALISIARNLTKVTYFTLLYLWMTDTKFKKGKKTFSFRKMF